MNRTTFSCACLAVIATVIVSAQFRAPDPNAKAPKNLPPPVRVTEAQAREWATVAAKDARGVVAAFCNTFDRLAGAVVPRFEQDLIPLNDSSSGGNQRLPYIKTNAQGQLQAFEWMAADAARRGTPIDAVPWPKGPVVWIAVNDNESPHVERVIIRRGDTIIEPIETHVDLNHSRGKDVDSYEGWVSFPVDAFAPTTDKVQIDLIPIPSKYGQVNGITRLSPKVMDQLYRF